MAIETIVTDLSLRLVLNGGTDKNGKAILKNKQFKRVKPNADVAKVHEVAHALASLQELKLHAVQLLSTSDISNP
ncbi:DUF1659 domain-containing protein [Bacillus cereus]|uniref:DUF1659 domain-containing protein n=1 Tax=Bacillus arachidis TaxID=2819290 RepID=A0ABS3NT51_9BACI|nr:MULTISPECIES: DUF1659 domain-containing protein [Bacillus]PGX96226.1 DUF1659 domain-containing protein [Bacillus cereus]MBO1623943.1 DUF1659 domain-containing protein [Bacillus arachidis]PFE00013.1 DUF1659 domain-containing protein [Bacillus sp. AFS023182]WIY61113.1 DUF1659 domain-containing protein [Bacillus arachidis]SDZ43658.1 Protein of unknown function [Bacillus sp. 166amftsu]